MKKQTLAAALKLANGTKNDFSRAAMALDGCPVGGWGETEQARRTISELLPSKDERQYTVAEFIDAAYRVDAAGRYRNKLDD